MIRFNVYCSHSWKKSVKTKTTNQGKKRKMCKEGNECNTAPSPMAAVTQPADVSVWMGSYIICELCLLGQASRFVPCKQGTITACHCCKLRAATRAPLWEPPVLPFPFLFIFVPQHNRTLLSPSSFFSGYRKQRVRGSRWEFSLHLFKRTTSYSQWGFQTSSSHYIIKIPNKYNPQLKFRIIVC